MLGTNIYATNVMVVGIGDTKRTVIFILYAGLIFIYSLIFCRVELLDF